MIFIASKVALVKQPAVSGGTIQLLVEKKGEKCARCWRWREDVGQTKEHPTLCARCAAVVKGVPA
jgi:isoleucyl-tRNA synthetase